MGDDSVVTGTEEMPAEYAGGGAASADGAPFSLDEVGGLFAVRAQVGEQLVKAEAARDELAAGAEVPGGPEPVCELGGRTQ